MQIKKSRLRQIIKEEVESAKFINIDEDINDGPASQMHGDNITQDDETISLDELVAQEITKAFSEGAPDLEETVRADPTYDPNNSPDDPNNWRDLNGKVVPPDQLNAPSMGNTAYEQQIHNFRIMMKDPEFSKEVTSVQEESEYQDASAGAAIDKLKRAMRGGDKKGDEDEKEKRGGAIDPETDSTEKDYVPQFEAKKKKKKKKDKDWMGDIKSTGEWTDYTIEELERKKAALMQKGERTAAEIKTVQQLNFAINAKQGDYKKKGK